MFSREAEPVLMGDVYVLGVSKSKTYRSREGQGRIGISG